MCSKGDTIIEIGANIGTETVGFADVVGCEGRVCAIEPVPANFEALKRSVTLHSCNNISLFPYAIGAKNEKVGFKLSTDPHASGIGRVVDKHDSTTIEVECFTLDSMAESLGAAKFLFMDVEGSEYNIIQGGQNYLKSYTPVIVLEAGPNQLARQGVALLDLFNELAMLNYSVYEITRLGLAQVNPNNFRSATTDWLCVQTAQQNQLIPYIKRLLWWCGWLPCVPLLNPMCKKAKRA